MFRKRFRNCSIQARYATNLTFLAGVASALNIAGSPVGYTHTPSRDELENLYNDCKSLRKDFNSVSRDYRKAVDKIAKQAS